MIPHSQRLAIVVLCALLMLITTSCARTQYTPTTNSRIKTSMENGRTKYYVGDASYSAGFFGGGLIEAVQSDSRAKNAAIVGWRLTILSILIGVPSAIGAGTALVLEEDNERIGGYDYLFLGSVIGLAIAVQLDLRAQARRLDAINIFNDSLADTGMASATRRTGGVVPPLPPIDRRFRLAPSPILDRPPRVTSAADKLDPASFDRITPASLVLDQR